MFVYVLRSYRTGRRYIGHTKDLYRRFRDHNSGCVKSTKAGKPWQLIAFREYLSRSEARWVERSLKHSKRDLDNFLGL